MEAEGLSLQEDNYGFESRDIKAFVVESGKPRAIVYLHHHSKKRHRPLTTFLRWPGIEGLLMMFDEVGTRGITLLAQLPAYS